MLIEDAACILSAACCVSRLCFMFDEVKRSFPSSWP